MTGVVDTVGEGVGGEIVVGGTGSIVRGGRSIVRVRAEEGFVWVGMMTRVVPVAAVVGVAVDTEAETIAPLAAAMSTAHRAVEGGTRTRIGSVLRGVMVVPKLNDPKEGIRGRYPRLKQWGFVWGLWEV